MHETAVKEIAYFYHQKGFRDIINTADKLYIPDLLMIGPNGQLLWVEIEDKQDKLKKAKFAEIRSKMKLLDGKLQIHYLYTKQNQLTKLGKTALNFLERHLKQRE